MASTRLQRAGSGPRQRPRPAACRLLRSLRFRGARNASGAGRLARRPRVSRRSGQIFTQYVVKTAAGAALFLDSATLLRFRRPRRRLPPGQFGRGPAASIRPTSGRGSGHAAQPWRESGPPFAPDSFFTVTTCPQDKTVDNTLSSNREAGCHPGAFNPALVA